jgi:hypothetical protein
MFLNKFLMGTHAFVTLSDKGIRIDSLIIQHYLQSECVLMTYITTKIEDFRWP